MRMCRAVAARRLAVATLAGWILAIPAGRRAEAIAVQDMNTRTAADLVNALLGSGVTASNISFTGAAVAGGTFTAGAGSIGFPGGIVLGSGNAHDVPGPNPSDNTSTDNAAPGDLNLDTIVTPASTQDAAVLRFDFIPCGTVVTFDYVFSSEEYNEFANSGFNDAFAFFVNGVNVALVPGTATPVAINTVNGGKPYGVGAVNPAFYRNNDLSDGGGAIDCEMDGLTVVLTAVAPVNSGVINTFKLAIADVGDGNYDSNVFVRAGSCNVAGFAVQAIDTRTTPNPVVGGAV
ncbi:MAG: choice-of-anchor L domain-containing protein, partial [bacterium]